MVALSRPSSAAAQRETPVPNPMESHTSVPVDNPTVSDMNFKRLVYYKKPPLAFLMKKDWQMFVRFIQHRARRPTDCSSRQRTKRMLHAFFTLYQEYCYVCDKLLPTGDEMQASSSNAAQMQSTFSTNNAIRDVSPVFSYEQGPTLNTTGNTQDPATSTSSTATSHRRHRGVFGPLLRSARHLLPNRTPYVYDRIQRAPRTPVDIYSRYRMRHYRGNYVLMRRNGAASDQVRQILVQVPIALELLMPKIQTKIEKIMRHCSFLRDPLEVAAELRHFNYSVSRSIAHFNNTRRIRCIIEEFLPVTEDNMEAEKSWLHMPLATGRASASKEMGDVEVESHNSHRIVPCRNNKATSSPASSPNPVFHKEVQVVSGPCERSIAEAIAASFSSIHRFPKEPPAEGRFADWTIFNIIKALVGLKVTQETLLDEMKRMRCEFGRLMSVFSNSLQVAFDRMIQEMVAGDQQLQLELLQKTVEELKIKCREEESKRRHVYNLMQEQLGNVRVYCRLRNIDDAHSYLLGDNDRVHVLVPPMEEFRFDKVFPANYRQSAVFDAVVPLVTSFIDGYNACFITYGGEASGKTYTLFGSSGKDHVGLVQRSLAMVLEEKDRRKLDWDLQLSAVLIEIYNDVYNDFLGDRQNVHLYIDQGLDEVFKSLKNVPINSESDVDALVQVCRHRRKVAKTALNPASSRSHLITLVRLHCSSLIHGEETRSFLALCDLAGFEDIIKAETQSNPKLTLEASHINRSLTAFNRVFVALRKQDPHTVPYRDAKLTHFLKPFLINSGKCCLIITVRSDKRSLCCSQNTLRFGRETRAVTLGKAKRQINLDKYMT